MIKGRAHGAAFFVSLKIGGRVHGAAFFASRERSASPRNEKCQVLVQIVVLYITQVD